MTLSEKNHAKLLKLLALTASPVDGEALNAVRMANKLMARANTSWSVLLDETTALRQQLHAAQRGTGARRPRAGVSDQAINDAFEFLHDNMRGYYFSLVVRLREFYSDFGYLTARQWEVLDDMVGQTREAERRRRKSRKA